MQVLFTRENVSVYPAKKQRITGRVSLLKLKPSVFFSWLPYRQPGSVSSDSTEDEGKADIGPSSTLCKTHAAERLSLLAGSVLVLPPLSTVTLCDA